MEDKSTAISVGNPSDTSNLTEFQEVDLADFTEMVKDRLFTLFGRYENSSGKIYVEVYHHGELETIHDEDATVVWRKGFTNQSEPEVDLILPREGVIPKLHHIINKGYSLVFSAFTDDELMEKTADWKNGKSAVERDGLLGTYIDGANKKRFCRINEYTKGEYLIEKGYSGNVFETDVTNEHHVRVEVDLLLKDGWFLQGSQPVEDDAPNVDDLMRILLGAQKG